MPDVSMRSRSADAPTLTPLTTIGLAVAAGAAAANVWYNQPMLGAMTRDLAVSEHAVSIIPTATQVGFALGILFLLPLGDRMDRRRLILTQLAATGAALAMAALAPTLTSVALASVLVGAGGSTAQQIIAFSAELASPESRGRVVGTVMSGLLSGVLLARVLSGAVADAFGWRSMYWLAAVIALVMAAGLGRVLPGSVPNTRAGYGTLMHSLASLARSLPALRRATLIQALVFGTVSAFWSVLALLLEAPAFGLGPTAAGLFGVIGVVGILAAPMAGRIADTRGPHGVIGLSTLLVAASFVLFAVWPTIPGLILGVVLVDLGAQACMVSNQSIIYGLAPDARGRVTTVYMAGMFAGGAIGSAIAGAAWGYGGGGIPGWRAVCVLCCLVALAAYAVHRAGRRNRAGTAPLMLQ